jgi:iron-sulfur cluster assembly accessory protein
MITVTENAVKHLRDLLQTREVSAGEGLRLSVEKGGCAGWQYTMKLDQPIEGDKIFTHDGVNIIVDQKSIQMLGDSQIDYEDGLSDSGFKVRNPVASRTCGCGSSFEPRQA